MSFILEVAIVTFFRNGTHGRNGLFYPCRLHLAMWF